LHTHMERDEKLNIRRAKTNVWEIERFA
jgi:hypothetical protein